MTFYIYENVSSYTFNASQFVKNANHDEFQFCGTTQIELSISAAREEVTQKEQKRLNITQYFINNFLFYLHLISLTIVFELLPILALNCRFGILICDYDYF